MKAVISCQLLVISLLLITGHLPLATAVHGQEPEEWWLRIESYGWTLTDNTLRWEVRVGRIGDAGEFKAAGPAEECLLKLSSGEYRCGDEGEIASPWARHLEDDVYAILEHLYQLSGRVRERRTAEARC